MRNSDSFDKTGFMSSYYLCISFTGNIVQAIDSSHCYIRVRQFPSLTLLTLYMYNSDGIALKGKQNFKENYRLSTIDKGRIDIKDSISISDLLEVCPNIAIDINENGSLDIYFAGNFCLSIDGIQIRETCASILKRKLFIVFKNSTDENNCLFIDFSANFNNQTFKINGEFIDCSIHKRTSGFVYSDFYFSSTYNSYVLEFTRDLKIFIRLNGEIWYKYKNNATVMASYLMSMRKFLMMNN